MGSKSNGQIFFSYLKNLSSFETTLTQHGVHLDFPPRLTLQIRRRATVRLCAVTVYVQKQRHGTFTQDGAIGVVLSQDRKLKPRMAFVFEQRTIVQHMPTSKFRPPCWHSSRRRDLGHWAGNTDAI